MDKGMALILTAQLILYFALVLVKIDNHKISKEINDLWDELIKIKATTEQLKSKGVANAKQSNT